MTAPAVMSMPKIDFAALEKEIARDLKDAQGEQIYSRAQVRLETAIKDQKRLEDEQKSFRREIARADKCIADLQSIREQQAANEADVATELNAVLETIGALQKAGVTL